MSKIGIYEFKRSQLQFRGRIRGTITMPRDAKKIYMGAGPPHGNVFCWAEISSIVPVVPDDVVHEYLILAVGDEVPPGYEYREPLFATPILFIYELVDTQAFDAARKPGDLAGPQPKPGAIIMGGKS